MPIPKPTKKTRAAAKKALATAAAPGAAWSANNSACLHTWSVLSMKVLGQHDLPFKPAGDRTMAQLPFFNKIATVGNQALEAEAVADMIIKLAQTVLAAKFEPGHDFFTAVEALSQILKDGAKTIGDLGAVVDEVLAFPIENFE